MATQYLSEANILCYLNKTISPCFWILHFFFQKIQTTSILITLHANSCARNFVTEARPTLFNVLKLTAYSTFFVSRVNRWSTPSWSETFWHSPLSKKEPANILLGSGSLRWSITASRRSDILQWRAAIRFVIIKKWKLNSHGTTNSETYMSLIHWHLQFYFALAETTALIIVSHRLRTVRRTKRKYIFGNFKRRSPI